MLHQIEKGYSEMRILTSLLLALVICMTSCNKGLPDIAAKKIIRNAISTLRMDILLLVSF